MNISDSNQNFASLLCRIELLEAEQNLCKQRVIWLKRYIDAFKKEFSTRSELQQIESLQQSIETLVNKVANTIPVNANTQEQRRLSALSDEEFKVERMILLLDRIYTVEEETKGKPVSVEEFLSRYNAGQRDFTGMNLVGVLNTLKILTEYDE